MTLRLTILLGACLVADQAVLPLNIHRDSTSASMSHADAATETQGDRHLDSIIAVGVTQDETGSATAKSQSPL